MWVILNAAGALRAGRPRRSHCLAKGLIRSTNRSYGNWSRLPGAAKHVVPVRIVFASDRTRLLADRLPGEAVSLEQQTASS